MTATGQRKWRVTVRNFSKMEMGVEQELTGPVTIIDEFNSFDAALELACQKRKIKHYTVTVEGPDGVAIDDEDLARCCALANQN